MGCDDFLEEKVAGTESPAFRDHLSGCEACRQDLADYEEIRQLYREASTERYAGSVSRLRRRSPFSWLPAGAAALLLLGVLFFVLFGGPGGPPESGTGKGEPGTAFFRVYLAPWDREEARLNDEMGDLWGRLASLERRWP